MYARWPLLMRSRGVDSIESIAKSSGSPFGGGAIAGIGLCQELRRELVGREVRPNIKNMAFPLWPPQCRCQLSPLALVSHDGAVRLRHARIVIGQRAVIVGILNIVADVFNRPVSFDDMAQADLLAHQDAVGFKVLESRSRAFVRVQSSFLRHD